MLKTGDGLAPAIEIACDGCRSTQDVAPVHLCAGCRSANDARLAAVKLRLSGNVDWEDVKKHGLYDRFSVPNRDGAERRVKAADIRAHTNDRSITGMGS